MTRAAHLAVGCWLTGIACLAPAPAQAADLRPRAVQAYDKHADETTRAFVARARKVAAGRRCDGVMSAGAGSGDGILTVPDGLIHHYLATAYVKGATLKQVESVARDYPAYPKFYKSVVSTKVISQKGDTYQVLVRIKEGEMGVTAVLDVRSTVEYRTLGDGTMSAISKSEEIRQVEDAGRPNEKPLPVGRDSGYLWRAHTFTHFTADKEGVFVVMETLGLSRRFPRGTGFLLEFVARRMGRKSVEGSLDEFLTAIRRSAGLKPATSSCN